MLSLLMICQLFTVRYKTVYWLVTMNCRVMLIGHTFIMKF